MSMSEIPAYYTDNQETNIFKNCNKKDNYLVKTIIHTKNDYSLLGQHKSFYSKTIQDNDKLVSFIKLA